MALPQQVHQLLSAGRAAAPDALSPQAAISFRYFNSSPEVIRLVVVMHIRFPLSLRNVEDLLFEPGIDICHETVPHYWNRFPPRSQPISGSSVSTEREAAARWA